MWTHPQSFLRHILCRCSAAVIDRERHRDEQEEKEEDEEEGVELEYLSSDLFRREPTPNQRISDTVTYICHDRGVSG